MYPSSESYRAIGYIDIFRYKKENMLKVIGNWFTENIKFQVMCDKCKTSRYEINDYDEIYKKLGYFHWHDAIDFCPSCQKKTTVSELVNLQCKN